MRRGIIYARSREDSAMPPWKQLILLFDYAKAIGVHDMGIIAVTENDSRHDPSSIMDLHAMLKKHDCHALLVLDLHCLSDDPSELSLIQWQLADEDIAAFDLFAII